MHLSPCTEWLSAVSEVKLHLLASNLPGDLSSSSCYAKAEEQAQRLRW